MAVYYTSPQSFINNVFLFVRLTTLGTFLEFWLIGSFSSLIEIWKRDHFVYHGWCTSIYRPLSYPFRSIQTIVNNILYRTFIFLVRKERGSYYIKRKLRKCYNIQLKGEREIALESDCTFFTKHMLG